MGADTARTAGLRGSPAEDGGRRTDGAAQGELARRWRNPGSWGRAVPRYPRVSELRELKAIEKRRRLTWSICRWTRRREALRNQMVRRRSEAPVAAGGLPARDPRNATRAGSAEVERWVSPERSASVRKKPCGHAVQQPDVRNLSTTMGHSARRREQCPAGEGRRGDEVRGHAHLLDEAFGSTWPMLRARIYLT